MLGGTAKPTSGNTPYHRRHIQFMNGGWPGGQEAIFLSYFLEFESFLVQEFKLFLKFIRIPDFHVP